MHTCNYCKLTFRVDRFSIAGISSLKCNECSIFESKTTVKAITPPPEEDPFTHMPDWWKAKQMKEETPPTLMTEVR